MPQLQLQVLLLCLHELGVDCLPQALLLYVLLEVGLLEGPDSLLHPLDLVLLGLDLDLCLHHDLLLLLALQDASRFLELVIESIDDIID